MFTPRQYQLDLKAGIYRSWQEGNRNIIAVSPTGSGKTKLMGMIARELTRPGVAIAHRKELVGQISGAMAELGVPHNVIAPEGTVRNCIARHIELTGRSHYDRRAKFTVSAVDTLIGRADSLKQWASEVGFWFVDECFPAGTLVDGKPIETIRKGDLVRAFDTQTGNFELRAVHRVFKNTAPDHMVRIDRMGHHALYATSGHPFWTQRGWVSAGRLLENDLLLEVRGNVDFDNRGTAIPVSENRSDILQPPVRFRKSGSQSKTTRACGHDMLGVPDRIFDHCANGQSLQGDRTTILRQDLLDGVSVESFIRDNGCDQSSARIGAHDCTEPHVVGCGSGESIGYAESDEPRPESAGWERSSADSCRNDFDGVIGRNGVCSATGGSDGFRVCATPLQDRLRAPNVQDSCGSRRRESFVGCTQEVGCSEGRTSAWVRVASVQVVKRGDPDYPRSDYVYNLEVDTRHTYVAGGVVVHNCHHVLASNKWGKGTAMFPNAYGLGVTATPLRADRKSLHIDQGGVFSDMVLGPTMRDLINEGALCDYRIFAPPASIDRASLDVGATGDFTGPSMRAAAHKSKIVGDIVGHYRKLVSGKRAICFVVDVEQAVEMAQAFRDAGYRAEAVSANTPEAIREQIIAKFAAGKLDILCNVDLFGEGFDVPAVEVVIMGRPTESYGLYVQQFGRALRVLKGKTHGIIIDHVGNVKRHGLPDAPRVWTLFNEERGKRTQRDPDAIPVTACPSCFMAYEAFHPKCPFCGHKPEPAGRSLPEQVDGDLVELDPKVLAEMRGEADRLMVPLTGTVNDPRSAVIARNWAARTEAQRELREVIATWAGPWHAQGASDSEIMRRFYFKFGVDVMTAQTLGTTEATELKDRINADI